MNSNNNELIFSLSSVLNELGYIEESLFLINKLVSASPNTPKYFFARANIYRLQGRLLDSIAGFIDAIQLLFVDIKGRSRVVEFKTIPAYMDVEDAAIVLYDLKSFLDENNIQFFLAYGTLLGLHRDGELLSYDHDLDIGLYWDVPRHKLVNLISQSKNFYISEKQLASFRFDWNFSVFHKTKDVVIDFCFFKPEGEFLDSGLDHLPNPLLWRFSTFKTKLIQYRGNVTPESKYISLAYAYARLYTLLDRAYWKKAFGYCYQIFVYEKEPWLVEIFGWLQVKLNEDE
jgi:hypothetical protein